MEGVGMLVISFKDVNWGLWCQLGAFRGNINFSPHQGIILACMQKKLSRCFGGLDQSDMKSFKFLLRGMHLVTSSLSSSLF